MDEYILQLVFSIHAKIIERIVWILEERPITWHC